MARASETGRGFFKLFIDEKEFKRGLSRVQRTLKQTGRSVANIGKTLLGAGVGLGAAFLPAIKSAAELEEQMNKFRVVFGDRADEVKEWGDGFAKQVGRSKKEVASFLASTQDLFVPLGFDPAEAEKLSKQVTKLGIDLASFNDTTDADAILDLQRALTGSGEVMKKYGVIVSEARVKQELLNQAIDPKTATEAQKAQARLNLIVKGTEAAQGDAERSAGSFTNQLKALKGAAADLAAAIGGPVLQVITPFITRIRDIVVNAEEWIKSNAELVKAAVKFAGGMVAAGAVILAFGTAIVGVGAIIGSVTAIVGGLVAVFAAITSPIGLAIAAVGALTLAFKDLLPSINFRGIAAEIKDSFGGIADAIAIGDISVAVEIMMLTIRKIFKEHLGEIEALWKGTAEFIHDVFKVFRITEAARTEFGGISPRGLAQAYLQEQANEKKREAENAAKDATRNEEEEIKLLREKLELLKKEAALKAGIKQAGGIGLLFGIGGGGGASGTAGGATTAAGAEPAKGVIGEKQVARSIAALGTFSGAAATGIFGGGDLAKDAQKTRVEHFKLAREQLKEQIKQRALLRQAIKQRGLVWSA